MIRKYIYIIYIYAHKVIGINILIIKKKLLIKMKIIISHKK